MAADARETVIQKVREIAERVGEIVTHFRHPFGERRSLRQSMDHG